MPQALWRGLPFLWIRYTEGQVAHTRPAVPMASRNACGMLGQNAGDAAAQLRYWRCAALKGPLRILTDPRFQHWHVDRRKRDA